MKTNRQVGVWEGGVGEAQGAETMTTGKSAATALIITFGVALAGGAVDAIWMLHQATRGIPGQQSTGVSIDAIARDLVSTTGLWIGAAIFIFVFAVARMWRDELRG
ncbi:MAG TPA: hypothetical protein VMJ93_15510 [Verrucomicrobiae bacterium]|nr:hypothetical protein [Verrucomicrobiae bacterium]